MASIITLDGVGATNEYGEEIAPPSGAFGWGDAAQTFVGWGIVAFAVGTGIFRLKSAISGFGRRTSTVEGYRRRRRR